MVDLANSHAHEAGYLQILRNARLLVAEYRRALAAEGYYGDLKRMSKTALAQDGVAHCEIPRRVFDRFYHLAVSDDLTRARAAQKNFPLTVPRITNRSASTRDKAAE